MLSTLPFHLAAWRWSPVLPRLREQHLRAVPGEFVSRLLYPGTLVGAVVLHLLLAGQDAPLTLATVIPVALAAALITLCEHRRPYRGSWRPALGEVRADLGFLVAVQGLLPALIGIVFALALVEPLHGVAPALAQFWPHHWAVGGQAVAMLLTADFLRYWLHRAAHKYRWLWRLHAVHHAPERLYWLNVGRFHPLDKSLQLTVDTLPFALLGVAPEVVALYFVFYATNGFFQHCNVRLRCGWLNHVFSTAELHRWHHSRRLPEGLSNYGNNLAVWDRLFGTWFLPRDREVGALGVSGGSFSGWQSVLMSLATAWARLRHWRPLVRAARDPAAAQARVLARILRANAATRFGRVHGFHRIVGVAEFRNRVPLHDYEDLRPWILAQDRGESATLTAQGACFFARTSGTTGEPKYIPLTPGAIRQHRREQRLLCAYQYGLCPEAYAGKVLAIVSPAVEGFLDSGTPYGSASGQLYRSLPWLARRRAVLPPEVFEIPDHDLRYRVILRLALAERDITLLASANPSTFLRLLDVLAAHRDELLASLVAGPLAGTQGLAPAVRRAVEARLRPDPARAARLRALAGQGRFDYASLWPGIRLVSTWTGGTCGVALEALRRTLPPATRVVDPGLVASELRATLTVDPVSNAGLPLLDTHVYEFVERVRWEAGERSCLGLEELREGGEYYLIVTTAAGLYRYVMNDVVTVTGFLHRTPLLRFLQKGRGVTSITGEKLHESQVLAALGRVQADLDLAPRLALMLADAEAARYSLFLEVDGEAPDAGLVAGAVDRALAALNIEYRCKRESGRLGPLDLGWLRPGTAEAHQRFHVQRGQREGQFKPRVLQYAPECAFPVREHLLPESAP